MRWRQDAALQRQRSVWREHDATLAKAWLAKVEHEMIVLPDFDPRDLGDLSDLDGLDGFDGFDDSDEPTRAHRIITLD
jgi:hypothetical protein